MLDKGIVQVVPIDITCSCTSVLRIGIREILTNGKDVVFLVLLQYHLGIHSCRQTFITRIGYIATNNTFLIKIGNTE